MFDRNFVRENSRIAISFHTSFSSKSPSNPQIRGPVRGAAPEPDFYYERSHDRYGGGGYEDDGGYGYKEDNRGEYKTARAVGTRRQNPMHGQHAPRHYARPEPYARPPK